MHAVDLPNSDLDITAWTTVDYFETYEEALKFVQETFGADEQGRICLISEVPSDEGDEEESEE